MIRFGWIACVKKYSSPYFFQKSFQAS